MSKRNDLLGQYSAFGTLGLLAWIAWKSEAFGMVIREMVWLVTGDVHKIVPSHGDYLAMLPVIFAVVVLKQPFTHAALSLVERALGEAGGHALTKMVKTMKEGHHFRIFFLAVLVEEVLARFLLLEWRTMTPLLSDRATFYALFLFGNCAWAWSHLENFTEKKDRHVLRALPQFIGGIFLTYVFVKYGLLATILAHFASNAFIFAGFKVRPFGAHDVFLTGYAALCGAVSFVLMERPLADIRPWFSAYPEYCLPGWGFWDYVKVAIFLSSSLVTLSGVLLYDRFGVKAEKSKSENGAAFLRVFGDVFPVAAWYATFTLLQDYRLLGKPPHRVFIVAALITCMKRSASPSMIARTFWFVLPTTYVAICIMQALGLWLAAGWLALVTLVHLPRYLMRNEDD